MADLLSPPYHLDTENIIRLIFHKSPLVASSREGMIAAQHGLEEFKANLSRLEPFVRTTGDASRFPKRRDWEAVSGEAAAGIEKETFDGAIFRLEGGASRERVKYGQVEEDQDPVERGSGGLLRGRVEIPFAGSRKRQDRVISAAFQESTARAAVLNYLSNYRSYASTALTYYEGALYYLGYVQAHQRKLQLLDDLTKDPRFRSADRSRVESVAGDTKVLIEHYQASYRSNMLYLLEYLGIPAEEPYVLEERGPDWPTRYLGLAMTSQGRQEMLDLACENNPKFRVLNNAIRDSELKRTQAEQGTLDITAFIEGTQFADGAVTFDDRARGRQVTGGVTVRLNDRRVLDASRRKAEAEIRQYQAQSEAERLNVQRQIAVHSSTLVSYAQSRPQILENIQKARAELRERSEVYLRGGPFPLTIDDVLNSLVSVCNGWLRLADNLYYTALAEDALMAATGEIYRLVGMSVADEGGAAQPAIEE